MQFSRQEYWSGLPFPPPGDLPNPRIKPTSQVSPALAGGFFTISTTWEALQPRELRPNLLNALPRKRQSSCPCSHCPGIWSCCQYRGIFKVLTSLPLWRWVWSLRDVKAGITPVVWDDSAFSTTEVICLSECGKIVIYFELRITGIPTPLLPDPTSNMRRNKKLWPIFYAQFTILYNELSQQIGVY